MSIMLEKEIIFINKLKEFYTHLTNKEYDNDSLVYVFAQFLSEHWDVEVLNNDEILHKIHLVCEEFEIDLDKTIELFKSM